MNSSGFSRSAATIPSASRATSGATGGTAARAWLKVLIGTHLVQETDHRRSLMLARNPFGDRRVDSELGRGRHLALRQFPGPDAGVEMLAAHPRQDVDVAVGLNAKVTAQSSSSWLLMSTSWSTTIAHLTMPSESRESNAFFPSPGRLRIAAMTWKWQQPPGVTRTAVVSTPAMRRAAQACASTAGAPIQSFSQGMVGRRRARRDGNTWHCSERRGSTSGCTGGS